MRANGKTRASARGFSLVEVLVTLIVVSVGLLGLAKMEALALASTKVAGSRSTAAIEASSLAAAMHANRAYWAAIGAQGPPPTVTVGITGAGKANISDPQLNAVGSTCTTPGTGACTPIQMAALDLQSWAVDVGKVLPAYAATLTCNNGAIAGQPVNCTISITWVENVVAVDAKQTTTTPLASPVYTLYVQP